MSIDKLVKDLAEQHAKQTAEPIQCPYCTEGRIEYDIVKDQFQCSDCRKEITALEYDKLIEEKHD